MRRWFGGIATTCRIVTVFEQRAVLAKRYSASRLDSLNDGEGLGALQGDGRLGSSHGHG